MFARIEDLLHSGVKKVLVVEDDAKTQAAIQSLLKQKNIEITMAASGKAALKQMRDTAFDCIILDLKLPDMTRLRMAARRWRRKPARTARRPSSSIPPRISPRRRTASFQPLYRQHRHQGRKLLRAAAG